MRKMTIPPKIVITGLGVLAAIAAMNSSIRAATIFQFDPDGSGGVSSVSATTLDQAAGNAIAVGAIDPQTGTIRVGTPFQLLYQAKVRLVADENNDPLAVYGLGNLAGKELTIVASFNEVATSGGLSASLSTNVDQTGSFIRLYFDDSADANDLQGTGFDDGTLIYDSVVNRDGVGSFAEELPRNFVALDQFVTNNYPGVQSVVGAGSTNLSASTTFLDPDFFVGNEPLFRINFDTFNNVPFDQVNPTMMFFNGQTGVGSVGSINGVSGPNFIFQTDATASFVVPEPSSVVMVSLGIAGVLGLGVHRRRHPVA